VPAGQFAADDDTADAHQRHRPLAALDLLTMIAAS